MLRFSNKELAKNKKVNNIIPENYIELKLASLEHETELAYFINYLVCDGVCYTKWFPKSCTINIGTKFYVKDFLLKIL